MESIQNAWGSNVIDLCRRIKQTIRSGMVHQEQCFVLTLLADCIGQYVKSWITCFGQENLSNSTAIGKELFTILDGGLQLINLCQQEDVLAILGCKGQLSDIIDDARVYAQMINRLIMRVLMTSPDAEKERIVEKLNKLKIQVESDCCTLQFRLEWAYQEDIDRLRHNLKCESGLLESNTPVSSMLQMLETGITVPNISNNLSMKEKLGAGSFGCVERAMWHNLPVAVKTFMDDTYLKDELKAFKKLLHADSSHVVQILGYTSKNQLVLEIMARDLEKQIKEPISPLPLIQLVDLILEIAKAVRSLHAIDVVHRDLKLSNVLVKITKEGRLLIKLTDFGTCKDNFKTAVHTEKQGTVMYMAPEMLEEREHYSRKVDVYSFGLICTEILTGKIRQPQKLREMIEISKVGKKPLLPTGIPKKLESLVHSCLEYDEEERPSFVDICDSLWLVKEELLTKEVEIEITDMKLRVNGLGRLRIENVSSPVMPPLSSTLTSKRAIYDFRQVYSVRDLPIDILVDIRVCGLVELKHSGKVAFRDSGIGPSPEALHMFGEFKLLKDQSKKFNLYLDIGGWDHSRYFSDAFSTAATRTTFVKSIVELFKNYSIFNGLFIDWKYISNNGKNYGKEGNSVNIEDVDNLVLVLKALRRRLPVGSFFIGLTCSPFPNLHEWPIQRTIDLVDHIYIFGTRLHSRRRSITSHGSNLYSSPHGQYSIAEAVSMYVSRGVPSAKIFIWVVLLGYGFSNTSGMGRPAGDNLLGFFPYNKLPLAGAVEKWDDQAKEVYAHDQRSKVVYTYDNVRSMIEKAKYVKDSGLGGIVVGDGWNDFPCNHERSIMKALHDHLTHG